MENETILARVRAFALREKLLTPGAPLRLAAAVSGGADSMALLRILLALQPEFGFALSPLPTGTKPLCGPRAPA